MKLQVVENKKQNLTVPTNSYLPLTVAPNLNQMEILTEDKTEEVLSFLSIRPVHTVVMTSFIVDNGIESEANRGKYYGYRNKAGELIGVALIGHTTLIETASEDAMKAFAFTAREAETPIYVMVSDGDSIETFWNFYKQDGSKPRLTCTEKLFELKIPFLVQDCKWDVRLAKEDELEQIAVAHAEVALLESGTCPLEKDRKGFFTRCLKRIERNRTFVVFEDDKLVFKADIAAQTDDVIYLEGVYVSPDYRGQGIAPTCLSKLSTAFLKQADHICMMSNVTFKSAHRSFEKAGYVSNDNCKIFYVKQK